MLHWPLSDWSAPPFFRATNACILLRDAMEIANLCDPMEQDAFQQFLDASAQLRRADFEAWVSITGMLNAQIQELRSMLDQIFPNGGPLQGNLPTVVRQYHLVFASDADIEGAKRLLAEHGINVRELEQTATEQLTLVITEITSILRVRLRELTSQSPLAAPPPPPSAAPSHTARPR